MFKIGEATTWSPAVHHWHPPEDADAAAREMDQLREALRRAEARELAALAYLDESNARLREAVFLLAAANARLKGEAK